MQDKDEFAVWLAGAFLHAADDEFAAAALDSLAKQAGASGDLDAVMAKAAGGARRPGDFGIEFVGPLLPVLLVEFGRLLWDAYVKSLAKQGGEALAKATVSKVQELVRNVWSGKEQTLTLSEVESRLREAAAKSGLTDQQTNDLVAKLRSPDMARAVAAA